MAAIFAALDPVSLDAAPVRFGAVAALWSGAPLQVGAVFAGDTVVDPLAGGQLGEELPAESDAAMSTLTAMLRDEGVDAEPIAVGATSAPRGLELAAAQLDASLLVVGSSKQADADHVAPGGTGARLLAGAPCAVAIVPRDWRVPEPVETFCVGFVDTAEGRDALRAAHGLAGKSGARLRVLAVVQERAAGGDEALADLRLRAEQAAQAAASGLLGEPVDVDVELGDPGDVLLAASRDADLLVCGARGYGATPATLLGGVTRRVTAAAGCPVIVLARA